MSIAAIGSHKRNAIELVLAWRKLFIRLNGRDEDIEGDDGCALMQMQ